MIQEEKELLLKDLSARLPYSPKVKVLSLWNEDKEVEETIVDSVYCVMSDGYINTETIDSDISLDNIVLYLRPMSSMTEEEYNEYQQTFDNVLVYNNNNIHSEHRATYETFDYLNSIHVDYRGLIPMGLALEAPEGMYKL